MQHPRSEEALSLHSQRRAGATSLPWELQPAGGVKGGHLVKREQVCGCEVSTHIPKTGGAFFD